jgi:predicted DsbA family dithiol-disulfide isomerase
MSHAIPVTVFSDYICPFCYVGDRRLLRLAEQVDLAITWRGVEIHPETPPDGMPLEALGYPPDLWARMMMHLGNLAAEEGIRMAERRITTNSHKALLLAEGARDQGPETFRAVHEALFHAFFTRGLNIGQVDVLEGIAQEAGMDAAAFERALIEPAYEQRLKDNVAEARRFGVTGVPTFVFGDRVVSGAVPYGHMAEAARAAAVGP